MRTKRQRIERYTREACGKSTMIQVQGMFLQCLLLFLCLCHTTRGTNVSCRLLNPISLDAEGDMPLRILHLPSDATYDVHDNATLTCDFWNFCSITWFRNGMTLDSLLDQNVSYRFSRDNQSVTIDDVMDVHQGTYECVGSNGISTMSNEMYLRVREVGYVDTNQPVIYSSHLVETEVVEGTQLRLYCYAFNYVMITWYRDGDLIVPDGERVILRREDQELILTGLANSDSGIYMCVASNGTRSDSRQGNVITRRVCKDAEILLNYCDPPDEVIPASLGSNLTITCVYSVGRASDDFVPYWYRFNGTASDQLNDTSFYVAPYFDASATEGTNYTVRIMLHNESGEQNLMNCTNQIFKSVTLVITNVTEGTYGYYVAFAFRYSAVEDKVIQIVRAVSKPVSPVVRSRLVGSTAGGMVLLVLLGVLVWRRYRLDIKLFIKETRESLVTSSYGREQDGRLYDVYVACCDVDAMAVHLNIMPALREKGYSTCLRITDFLPGQGTHDEIWRCMGASRRCLLIISDRQMCQDNIGLVEVQAAMALLKNAIIPVLLEPVTKSKLESYPVFRYLLKTNRKLICTRMDLTSPSNFRRSSVLKGIRLGLPPPSEGRRRNRQIFVVRGYLDDDFPLVDDDESTSNGGSGPYDFGSDRNVPDGVVVTTRTQYYKTVSL